MNHVRNGTVQTQLLSVHEICQFESNFVQYELIKANIFQFESFLLKMKREKWLARLQRKVKE